MILLLSILAIFLPFILLYFNLNKYKPIIYLSGFFFLLSCYAITQLVLLSSDSVFLVSIFLIRFGFVSYLIGPMLYLYIRSVLTDDHRIKKQDAIHLFPLIFWLVNVLPYFQASWSFKLYIASEFVKERMIPEIFQTSMLADIFPTEVIILSRPGFILAYTLWSAGMIIHFIKRKCYAEVFLRHKFMMRWLWMLIGLVLVLASVHFLLMFEASRDPDFGIYFTSNILHIISSGVLTLLIISPFYFPEILYGLPRKPANMDISPVNLSVADHQRNEGKRKGLYLEAGYLEYIGQKADEFMKELHPFLQPDFTMAKLSVLINIPVHHLAYYLREIRKKGFTEYRNEWRVNYAKQLMRDGKVHQMTLEAIGNLSGFSSRNTFLNAFKKSEGISPGVFASRLKSQPSK